MHIRPEAQACKMLCRDSSMVVVQVIGLIYKGAFIAKMAGLARQGLQDCSWLCRYSRACHKSRTGARKPNADRN